MDPVIRGLAYVVGDDVDTDQIIPAKHLVYNDADPAERKIFGRYALSGLPEGRRGIFVGGGASVRIGRILGADRMCEMMLTGRKYGAEEGLALGLAHYAVAEGEALPLARKLAVQIAQNASLSNYMMIQAIARISDMSRADGLFTESLAAAI